MLTLFQRRSRSESEPVEENLTDETAPADAVGEDKKARKSRKDAEPNLAHGWTNGERLKSLAATGLVWAFCGAGVLSFGMNLLDGGSTPQAASVEVQDAGQSQRVSEFATGFVTQYLTASRDQEELVTSMLAKGAGDSLSLPSQPATIGAVTSGEAVQVTENSWIVTVVVEQPATEEQAAARRYWQVPVVTNEAGNIAASALPSLIAAPTSGDLSTKRSDEVNDANVESTVNTFAQAFLAGQGEVGPLTSPGSGITAVTPVPYSEVSVSSLRAAQEVPSSPSEGDVVRTQITVSATAVDGSKTQLGYTVDLRYRDRWEVAAINPTTDEFTTEGEQS